MFYDVCVFFALKEGFFPSCVFPGWGSVNSLWIWPRHKRVTNNTQNKTQNLNQRTRHRQVDGVHNRPFWGVFWHKIASVSLIQIGTHTLGEYKFVLSRVKSTSNRRKNLILLNYLWCNIWLLWMVGLLSCSLRLIVQSALRYNVIITLHWVHTCILLTLRYDFFFIIFRFRGMFVCVACVYASIEVVYYRVGTRHWIPRNNQLNGYSWVITCRLFKKFIAQFE